MRDLVLLAVAALGTLGVLPVVVERFFPGVLAAALATAAVVAVVLAVLVVALGWR